MERNDLLARLRGAVSPREWARLEDGASSLVVSRWNRAALLRMRDWPDAPGTVPDARVRRMEELLRDYLARYMADRPEGHKWILLSCAFLAFIAREPLHPREIVYYETRLINGKTVRLCPARDDGEGSLCGFCVCGGPDRGK